MKIPDRIKELRRVPASELRPNPKNWRVHSEDQSNALRALLAKVGFAGAVLARELDDGTLMLIDGHLRAETLGDEDVPVLILDVTEEEANLILATFDPIGGMAEANYDKTMELLEEIDTDNDDIQALLDSLTKLGTDDADAPEEFESFDENINVTHTCPKCSFEW